VKTDLLSSPLKLYDHCGELFQRRARDLAVSRLGKEDRPVVELQLSGLLPFDRSALEMLKLEAMLMECFEPLLVLLRNMTYGADFAVEAAEGLSRGALERQVLSELFTRDARFSDHSEEWARTALSIKQLAMDSAGPEAIVAELDSAMDHILRRGHRDMPGAPAVGA
jgi:DNA repair protein SbcD/Mre11